jgi:hypothetical protein
MDEILVDDTHALMTPATLNALPEYSASIPTSADMGKRWKRADGRGWWMMGEYAPHEDPAIVRIIWRKVLVVFPAPPERPIVNELELFLFGHSVVNDGRGWR